MRPDLELNGMSSDAMRYNNLPTAVAPATNGEAVSVMASAVVPDGAFQTPLAATASGSAEPVPDVMAMPEIAGARDPGRLALSMRALVPMVAGGLAVAVATTIAVLSSPDDSATIIPVTTLRLPRRCALVH